MTFVALARVRFGEGWIEPGETVPVEPGRHYDAMVQRGEIALLPDNDEHESADEIVRGATRDELDERAHGAGVDEPDALPNKDAVAEAIETREHLDGLSRKELNRRAELAGVDAPEKLPNKGAVIDALTDAQSE